jgi:hypothetical protein
VDQNITATEQVTDTTTAQNVENQEQQTRTYTQEEFDKHMAGLKHSLQNKFEKQFAELGDLEELKQLKATAEKQRQEEALKKGEFEKVLQEMAAKKDAEIQQRDEVIKEYKVNTPLLNAAAKYKAVAPEQVQSLLRNSVRLNEVGEAEVIDANGTVRYDDSGKPLGVDDLVREFLESNKHFVQAAPATTNTKSATAPVNLSSEFDLSKLDLSNPEHRKVYKEALSKGVLQ